MAKRAIFALLAFVGTAPLALATKAKSSMYDESFGGDYALGNQQTEYYRAQGYPEQPVQTAYQQANFRFDQQVPPGGSVIAAPSYDQQVQSNAQYQMQNSYAMLQQSQMANPQQVSFLGAAQQPAVPQPPAPSDSGAVMAKLTEIVQQESQALSALRAEQQQMNKFQSQFTEASLRLFTALADLPKCKDMTKPVKVEDEESCDSACVGVRKGYTTGEYKDNDWSGLFGKNSFFSRTHRCDCDSPSGKVTICNDDSHGSRTTASLVGILGLVMMLFHV
jgi:hypothetical protein